MIKVGFCIEFSAAIVETININHMPNGRNWPCQINV